MAKAVTKETMTFSGDIADMSDAAGREAFPNPIKGAGSDVSPHRLLPFRRERMVSDATDGYDTALPCCMVPKDEVV